MRTSHIPSIARPLAYPAIDGIRFYAAFLVFMTHAVGSVYTVLYHIPELNMRNPTSLERLFFVIGDGNHGVDFFFIISGFLMGRACLNSRSFSYPNFIRKRFVRIYPAFLISYLAAVLADLYFGWVWSLWSFFAGLAFLNGIPGLGVLPYHYVSWSLGYEFAFYFVMPVVLILPAQVPDWVKASVLLAAFAGTVLLVPQATWMMRGVGLFSGLLLATISDARLKMAASKTPLLLAVTPYAAYLILKDTTTITYIQSYAVLVPAAMLLIMKITFSDNILNRIASANASRFLGTISYSFYLWHTTCVSVTMFIILPWLAISHEPTILAIASFSVIAFSLSVLVAFGSYVMFESFYFSRRPEKAPAHPMRGDAVSDRTSLRA